MEKSKSIDSDLETHFSDIADSYRSLRQTDIAPILKISSYISSNESVSIIDIGSGTGRYDELMLDKFESNVFLTCVDRNSEMIEELKLNLSNHHRSRFRAILSDVKQLPLDNNSFDIVVSFNAFHHFDLSQTLREISRINKKGGLIFIYTRTPIQNAVSIWGKYFPEFKDKEKRLFSVSDIESACDEIDDLSLSSVFYFNYPRRATLDDLVEHANSKHYSTFSLYGKDEFEASMIEFREKIEKIYDSSKFINWTDGNVLYVIKNK